MTILLIVGVALVVFGALLLLKFPDRPGGRVALGKVEVSSQGAGLPLVVIGVVCVVIGVGGAGGGGGANDNNGGAGSPTPTATPTETTTPTPTATPLQTPTATPTAGGPRGGRQVPPACGPDPQGENFAAVSVTLQLGEGGQTIPTGGRVPKDLRLRLFDGEDFLGVIDLKPRPTGDGLGALFRVEKARDANCRPAKFVRKDARDADPSVLLNWNTGTLIANDGVYELRLGYDPAGAVRTQNFKKVQ